MMMIQNKSLRNTFYNWLILETWKANKINEKQMIIINESFYIK